MGALVFKGIADVEAVFDSVFSMPYSEFGDMLDGAFACTPVGAYVDAEGGESGSVYALSDVLDVMVDPLFELAEREGDTRDMQNATAFMTVVQEVRELERVALIITDDTSVAPPLMDDETARYVLGLWLGSDGVSLWNAAYWERIGSVVGKTIASGYMRNVWSSVCSALERLGVVADKPYWERMREELFIELYCSKIPAFSPSIRVA